MCKVILVHGFLVLSVNRADGGLSRTFCQCRVNTSTIRIWEQSEGFLRNRNISEEQLWWWWGDGGVRHVSDYRTMFTLSVLRPHRIKHTPNGAFMHQTFIYRQQKDDMRKQDWEATWSRPANTLGKYRLNIKTNSMERTNCSLKHFQGVYYQYLKHAISSLTLIIIFFHVMKTCTHMYLSFQSLTVLVCPFLWSYKKRFRVQFVSGTKQESESEHV